MRLFLFIDKSKPKKPFFSAPNCSKKTDKNKTEEDYYQKKPKKTRGKQWQRRCWTTTTTRRRNGGRTTSRECGSGAALFGLMVPRSGHLGGRASWGLKRVKSKRKKDDDDNNNTREEGKKPGGRHQPFFLPSRPLEEQENG